MTTSHSQLGQDIAILRRFYPPGPTEPSRYYVDVGAGDGIAFSNTKALEASGWNGICIEAASPAYEALVKNRPGATCVQACVYGTETRVTFSLDPTPPCMMSGIEPELLDRWRGVPVSLSTTTLAVLFEKHKVPTTIDYLSIDVRGAEFAIFRSFPFHRYQFGVISINHDNAPWRQELHQWLQANDYRFVEANQWEDWVVHNSVFPLDIPVQQPTLWVYPRLQQGLGNQLFAAAAAIKYAKDHNGVVKWMDNQITVDPSVNQHSGSYLGKLIHLPPVDFKGSVIVIDEPAHLEPIPLPAPPPNALNIVTRGYFQQTTHVADLATLTEVIHWTPEDEAKISAKYSDILSGDQTVSVHIRRGDYVTFFGNEVARLVTYTEKAINYIKSVLSTPKFVFFSDDLAWTKARYGNETGAVFVERDLDHYELYVMSRCKHHIIANSSFSWWAACLGGDKGITVAPYPWFADRPKAEMYLPGWVKLRVDQHYTLPLGIGDLFLTACMVRDHDLGNEISFSVNNAIVQRYRDNSQTYMDFVRLITPKLYPKQEVTYINNNFMRSVDHLDKEYPIKTYNLPPNLLGPCDNIPKLPQNYVLVMTRCRIDNVQIRTDIQKRMNEIVTVINNIPIPKVVIGERLISGNLEEQKHGITTIYPWLKFGPADVDLTEATLSNTPSLELLQRDIAIISGAKLTIGVGCGGNFCLALLFSQAGLFLCDYKTHTLLNNVHSSKPAFELTDLINTFTERLAALTQSSRLTDGFIRMVPDFIPTIVTGSPTETTTGAGDVTGGVTDIFIKTYPRDYPWLPFVYQSIAKFCTGFRRVVVVSELGEPLPPTPVGLPFICCQVEPMPPLDGIDYRPTLGYLSQQAVKMSWPDFTDADSVFIIDSDTIFQRPFDRSLLIGPSGKFTLNIGQWEADTRQWKTGADFILEGDAPYDFMPTPGWCYTRATTLAFRAYIKDRFGGSVYKLVRYPHILWPSEFNLLGAYMWKYQKDQYDWCEGPLDNYRWRPCLLQESSWLGVDRVKDKLTAVLRNG